jgi:hypothetical protein
MTPRLRAAALVGMGLVAWGCMHADALLEINVLAPAPPGARIDDLSIDVTDAGVHKTYGIPSGDGGLSSTVPLKLGIHVPLSAAGTFHVVVSGFDRSSGCKTAEGMASPHLDPGAITRDVVVQMERVGDGGCSDGGATGGAFGGTGGTTGAGGGMAGNSGAGGGFGIGGFTGGGGALGLGGNSGVGGTPGTGGRGGAGGSAGVGGRVGTGGAGIGGAGIGGAGIGGSPGVGGTTGLGGSGMGGSGTGGAMVTVDAIAGLPNTFGDQLKDSFILFPCYAVAAQDCILIPNGTACPVADATKPFEDQGLVTKETFTLGGTVGRSYTLTIRVNGITEGKAYMGGIRSAGNADPPNPDAPAGLDTFYTGGAPVDLQNYKVYKLIVLNPNGTEVQHYYLNSMPTSAFENHNTFPIGYTHDIIVPGGGSIVYQTASRNCRAIDNCGAGSRSVSCLVTDGRNVPNEPALQVPAMYMGQSVASINLRNGATQPFHAQILHITVTAAAAAP